MSPFFREHAVKITTGLGSPDGLLRSQIPSDMPATIKLLAQGRLKECTNGHIQLIFKNWIL